MPRSAAGVYTLPAGNPVVTNTLITSTWANDTMPDLGSEITNSLDRSGRGGMLAPIKGVDGTVALPLFSFTNEPSSGFYRSAAGVINVSILGSSVGSFSAAGFTGSIVGHASLDLPLTGGTLTGNLAVTGNANAGVGYTATNSSSGVQASGSFTAVGDTFSTIFGQTSSAYNALALIGINAGFVYAGGSGGLAIAAGNGAGTLRFAAGGSTEHMRIGIDGRVGIGGAAALGASLFEITAASDARMVLNGSSASVSAGGAALFYRTGAYVGRVGVSANAIGDSSANMLIAANTNLVFCANNSLTTLMAITVAGLIVDGNGLELGFKGMPASSVVSGVISRADRGKCVKATGGVTIPNNVFEDGDVVTIYNSSAGSLTITASIGTLALAGTLLTGNRTFAQRGICTVYFIGSPAVVGIISGAGLS